MAWSVFLCLLLATSGRALTVSEDFSADPQANGWKIFNPTNLFTWNATNQNLEVTWDSSKTNSYFYKSLGTILTRKDEFSFEFDLLLNDAATGVSSNRPSTFPLCIGLQNLTNATKTNFFRGAGQPYARNLVEFDYFPESPSLFGATVWPAVWSTNGSLNYNGSSDYTLMELPLGVTMRVVLRYTTNNETLATSITTNGVSIGAINSVKVRTNFADFRVDTFSIESYSDYGQANPAGSLLAHGIIDNVLITLPPPPVRNLRGFFTNAQWNVQFTSRLYWNYVLEATQNLQTWNAVSQKVTGTGADLSLIDTNAPSLSQFYRVKAERF